MKPILVVGFAILLAAALAQVVRSAVESTCGTGEAKAFIAIQPDPAYLVGTIPSRFTREAGYFSRRYNCKGGSAQVRRVDEGVYEVRFPRVSARLAVVTATSDEGVAASAASFGNTVRVALRGPLHGPEIMERRDVPFVVVVY